VRQIQSVNVVSTYPCMRKIRRENREVAKVEIHYMVGQHSLGQKIQRQMEDVHQLHRS